MISNTKDRILDGAAKVFSEKGYHMASMDEIAAIVGVAKGTLYYNFSSKAQLFAGLVEEGYRIIISEVAKRITPQMSYTERIQKIIEVNYKLFSIYSKLAMILCGELTTGIDDKAKDMILAAKESYIQFVSNIVAHGIEEREFADSDPELVAVGIIGVIEAIFSRKTASDKPWSDETVIDEIQTALISGIRYDRV
jgi:AcrR family transcriptional regulator